jgi:hypothetical protein
MKQAKLMSLPIDSIKLDEENPRIKQCLENYTTVTPEAIALALWDSGDGDAATSYRVLRDSIKDSGGIIHPIVVNHEDNGDYVAIEGNTRLQIYKDFVQKNVPGEWSQITALVYEGLTKVEKHSIRLQSHLVGPRDWDPYSKAKYLYQLSEIEMLPMNSIVNMCGGNKNEITKAIDAYKYMKMYYEPYAKSRGLEPDTRDYSKFREHENARIKSAIQHKGYPENQFAKWVVDENIDKAQSVRLIPAIMRNKEAHDTFLKGNLTEAETVLRAAELSNADLSQYPYEVLSGELFKQLMTLPATEVDELANNPDKAMKRDSLERLKSKLDFIINMIIEQEK